MITATADSYALGEGPYWDPDRKRLLWVDIIGCAVFEGTLQRDGTIVETNRHDFDRMVSAVVASDRGALLIAARDQLVVVDPDGARRPVAHVLAPDGDRRLNDGAVDPDGRFVVGTLRFGGGSTSESLVRLEPDSSLTIIDDDLTLSNGIAWSADGSRMYSVDTHRQTVYRRSNDHDRRIHLAIDDGYPDGIAVDADDHLWVAIWGAGEVRRFSPDGVLAERISVPAPHTSSVAFAGDDLRTLVVTTADEELTDAQRAASPLSGRIFTLRTDVAGLPSTLWKET